MRARLAGLRPVIGLVLTVVFLVLALQRVDLAGFVDELRGVNYVWLVPSAVCTLVGYVLRTVRWRIILSGAARAPLSTLFPVLIMGFAINNLLPGRLGEFWRAYLLGRKRNVPKTFALASVVVERVFDGLTLIALLADRVHDHSAARARARGRAAGRGCLCGRDSGRDRLAVETRTSCRCHCGGCCSRSTAAWPAWIESASKRSSTGSRLAARTGARARGVLSAGVWIAEACSYLFLSRGVNLGLPSAIELPAIILAVVIINLGIMVPSGPGYVGTQEFFGTAALAVVGANPQAALALIVVSHVVQYALVTGLGLVFFAREQLSPRDLRPALAEQASS